MPTDNIKSLKENIGRKDKKIKILETKISKSPLERLKKIDKEVKQIKSKREEDYAEIKNIRASITRNFLRWDKFIEVIIDIEDRLRFFYKIKEK